MQLKIEVVLDDSTQQGFDAYDLIKEACAEYGAKMRVFQFLPDHDPPPPSGRRRGGKPPAGYAYPWWRVSRDFTLLPPPPEAR